MSGVRVTATDRDNPSDTTSCDIEGDDYVLVVSGRCSAYDVVVHYRKDGTQTHVITVRNVKRGAPPRVAVKRGGGR